MVVVLVMHPLLDVSVTSSPSHPASSQPADSPLSGPADNTLLPVDAEPGSVDQLDENGGSAGDGENKTNGPPLVLFFAPFVFGVLLSMRAGAPTKWMAQFPAEMVATVALGVAYFLTLSAWKDEMTGAGYLKSVARFFSLVTPTFLLGTAGTAAALEAEAQGWSVPFVILAAAFGVPVLLMLGPLFDKMMGGKRSDDRAS